MKEWNFIFCLIKRQQLSSQKKLEFSADVTSNDRKSLAVVASESLLVNDDKSSLNSSGRMVGGSKSVALTFEADLKDSDGFSEAGSSLLQDEIDCGGDEEEFEMMAARWRRGRGSSKNDFATI